MKVVWILKRVRFFRNNGDIYLVGKSTMSIILAQNIRYLQTKCLSKLFSRFCVNQLTFTFITLVGLQKTTYNEKEGTNLTSQSTDVCDFTYHLFVNLYIFVLLGFTARNKWSVKLDI